MEILAIITYSLIIIYSLYKIITFGPDNPIIQNEVIGYCTKYPDITPEQIYKCIFIKYFLFLTISILLLTGFIVCL